MTTIYDLLKTTEVPGLVVAVGGVLRRRAGCIRSALSRRAVWARVSGLIEMLVSKSLDVKRLSGVFTWGRWLWLLLLVVVGLLDFGGIMVAYTWRSCNESWFLTFWDG